MKTALFALAGIAVAANAGTTPLINEFEPNPIGTDPAMVNFEIKGQAGTTFNGFVYSVEGDFGGGVDNFIDREFAVSGTFDANGILNVMIGDLENPSFTVVLASGGLGSAGGAYNGTNGADLFGTVFDAVTVNDIEGDLANSIVPTLGVGTNLAYVGSEPVRTFRDGINNDWYSVDFDGFVYDAAGNLVDNSLFDSDPTAYNFGGVNQTVVPAPAAAGVLAFAGLAATRRRRG